MGDYALVISEEAESHFSWFLLLVLQMTSFDANEVDLAKEILDRTRADDDFWDQVSEQALLDNNFVMNECGDHIPARYFYFLEHLIVTISLLMLIQF
jgi:hypothetical protein